MLTASKAGNGFDVIDKRLTQGSEATRLYADFIESIAAAEDSYSESLKTACQRCSKVVEYGFALARSINLVPLNLNMRVLTL